MNPYSQPDFTKAPPALDVEVRAAAVDLLKMIQHDRDEGVLSSIDLDICIGIVEGLLFQIKQLKAPVGEPLVEVLASGLGTGRSA